MSAVPWIESSPLRPAIRPAVRPASRLRHVALVVNERASGLARHPEVIELAARALTSRGARLEIHRTGSLEDVAELWPYLAERRVVLVGGDGTLHAAANVDSAHPELALLPAGRANNVARSLGIPLDLRRAAELAVEGSVRSLDLISAETAETSYLAVEGVSVGLHAHARALYDAPNSADLSAALGSAIEAVREFDGVTVSLSREGAGELLRIGQLFVANFPRFGPGLRVAPDARPDDGELNVVALEWTGRRSLLSTLARLRRGTHIERPGTRSWNARRVRIATGGDSPVIADTTNLGTGPVTVSVVPSALAVVAP